jgi:hypothetical protein
MNKQENASPDEDRQTVDPVPSPVERRIVTVVRGNQELSEEQRLRITRWLEANQIEPKRVSAHEPITIECKVRGDSESFHVIGFTEYYVDSEGNKVFNEKTRNEALTYERWVAQVAELEPDPSWEGWDAWRAANLKDKP